MLKNCKTKIYCEPRYQRSASALRLRGPWSERERIPPVASLISLRRRAHKIEQAYFWSTGGGVWGRVTAPPPYLSRQRFKAGLGTRLPQRGHGRGLTFRREARSPITRRHRWREKARRNGPRAREITLDNLHYLVANSAQSALIPTMSVFFQH